MEPRQRPSAGDRAARDGRSAEQIAADRKASQARESAAAFFRLCCMQVRDASLCPCCLGSRRVEEDQPSGNLHGMFVCDDPSTISAALMHVSDIAKADSALVACAQVRAEHRRQIKDALVYIRECIRRPMHSSYTKCTPCSLTAILLHLLCHACLRVSHLVD